MSAQANIPPRAPQLQRARGEITLSVQASPRGTVLDNLRQSGSLKALFPRTNSPALEAVLVNTAGGITGGDRFAVRADTAADTVLTLTSQTAERAYCAQGGQVGRLQTRIRIGAGAHVSWLPQETILFQGSALARTLRVDMQAGASFLMVEPLVFGRTAMGEVLTDAQFSDRIEIVRAGTVAYLDAITLRGNIAARLVRPALGGGAGAMASLVYIAPDAPALLPPLRGLLGATAGASLLGEDMIVLRCLAQDSYLLRQTLIPALALLTKDNIPRCWMT